MPFQFSSLYDGQEVSVWPDCPVDPGTDFLVLAKQTKAFIPPSNTGLAVEPDIAVGPTATA